MEVKEISIMHWQVLKVCHRFSKYLVSIWVIICLFPFTGKAQQDTVVTTNEHQKISFKDPEDGAFDMSNFLIEHRGLLPIPSIVTEPAVGYGGGAGLIYFHKRKKQYQSYVPLDMSGIGGLATENGTWALGVFHFHTFGENRVRTMSIIGHPSVHYDYYGRNNEWLAKHPLRVKMSIWTFVQRAQYRIGDSHFYVGGSYTYMNSDVKVDTIGKGHITNEILSSLNHNETVSLIKPIVVYDSRDNIFTPTKGINAELQFKYSAQWLGSVDDYHILNAFFYGYQPINPKLFSAWRFEGKYLGGDAPFYAYPYINLRGIAAMRYQDTNMMLMETEWRYNIYRRYSLVAFTGVGKVYPELDKFNNVDWAYSFGTGFRYNIARLLGLHMGTDFAWGDGKDFAFYIVFGSSW